MRALLVILQVSLSLVLLSGGGLLFKTLLNYQSLASVPDPGQVLLLSLQPSHQQYDENRAVASSTVSCASVSRGCQGCSR